MDEFVRYLDKHHAFVVNFPPEERNEVLRMMYVIIMVTARDGYDTLTVTPHQIIRSRDTGESRQFDISGSTFIMSFREALEHIIERDEIVQHHLQLISETPFTLSYRLIK
jgi:hypothetical protein